MFPLTQVPRCYASCDASAVCGVRGPSVCWRGSKSMVWFDDTIWHLSDGKLLLIKSRSSKWTVWHEHGKSITNFGKSTYRTIEFWNFTVMLNLRRVDGNLVHKFCFLTQVAVQQNWTSNVKCYRFSQVYEVSPFGKNPPGRFLGRGKSFSFKSKAGFSLLPHSQSCSVVGIQILPLVK